MDKIIKRRMNAKVIGFNSQVASEDDDKNILSKVQPEDLLKFGLIPELIGRLPVITALSGLDTDALVKILTVPKNSIVAQYKKLFELDDVELYFEEDALKAIAQKAQEQHTGARGLRGIIEGILTDLMFETPSDSTIEKIIITKDVVTDNAQPQITRRKDKPSVNLNNLSKKDAMKRPKRNTAS